MLKIIFAQVVGLSLVLSGYGASQRKAGELGRRAKAFHESFFSGKPDQMWGMLSRRLQKQNDNDKQHYVSQLPKSKFVGVHHVDIEVEEIKAERVHAKVIIKITIWSGPEKKLGVVRNEDSWVFERGNWFFDGQTNLDEKLFDNEGRPISPCDRIVIELSSF